MAEISNQKSEVMKTYAEPKPLGTATFEPIRYIRYLNDENVFELALYNRLNFLKLLKQDSCV